MLATGRGDQTVRIWDAATAQPCAVIRVENTILACAWLGSGGLAIGGSSVLYLLTSTDSE
jgi:hypothetical protein